MRLNDKLLLENLSNIPQASGASTVRGRTKFQQPMYQYSTSNFKGRKSNSLMNLCGKV